MPFPLHRLFFAVKPAAGALPAIAEHRRAAAVAQPVRDEHAHVTMEIFDDHASPPRSLIDILLTVGDAIDRPGFALALSRLVGTTRSVALRPGKQCRGLGELQRAIHDGVTRAGLAARRGWSFSPHLTLGYRDAPAFSRAVPPIAWTVDELVLVHSFVGATRHETIGRWPLAADSQLSLF